MFASEPLPDSEDKIIERLGPCDVPVDYMDLLSHRIRCRKIEIFHYDDKVSFTSNDVEEEQELSGSQLYTEDHTDDEDRTLQLVKGLDCLIRRIEQMQLVIKERKKQQELESGVTEASTEQIKKQEQLEAQKKLESSEKPETEKENLEATEQLSFEEQMEVRSLQHGHHRLQCEINEIISNYRALREVLQKQRTLMCEESRRGRKLGEQIVKLQTWSQEVAKELPVCKERYQRLIQKKLTKVEAARVIRANIAKAYRRSKNYLSKRQLRFDLREFHAEIDELLEYANDLHQDMMRRFTSFENDTALPRTLIEDLPVEKTQEPSESSRLTFKPKNTNFACNSQLI